MHDRIKIILTRESVSQGDDVLAPNEKLIYLPLTKTVSDLINKIIDIHYLANIFGGKATWIMKNDQRKIAVLAQQWKNAKFLVDETLLVNNLKNEKDCVNIHFDYLTQQDPDVVYQNLVISNDLNYTMLTRK